MAIMDAALSATNLTEVQTRIHREYADNVEHRHHFLFRLQATAAAASDEDIAAEVRRSFIEGFEKLVAVSGNDHKAVKDYISVSMFSDVAMAIRLPHSYWPALPAG
jgi:hypothetical protein